MNIQSIHSRKFLGRNGFTINDINTYSYRNFLEIRIDLVRDILLLSNDISQENLMKKCNIKQYISDRTYNKNIIIGDDITLIESHLKELEEEINKLEYKYWPRDPDELLNIPSLIKLSRRFS